jgi:pyruvate,orthophosphate dikinase
LASIFKIGVMIELPSAALAAGELAREADSFSFGTNDLTQMTFGLSRDDSAAFLETYLQKGLLANDPFQNIAVSGVGELMKEACQRARAVNPSIKLGVCGEHAGDPESIAFFESIGMDYISCSAYRVPVARLAAAQATCRQKARHETSGLDIKDAGL